MVTWITLVWRLPLHRIMRFILFCLLPGAVLGQGSGTPDGRIEILNADRGEYDDRIATGAQRLKGNVRFKHKDAVMHCDSAYFYNDQRVMAFGHVRIDQGDSLHVRADRCMYNGPDRTARLEGNVLLRNGDMELSTSALDHDLRNERAVYSAGGRIVSNTGNVLTSERGTYLSAVRRFIFSKDVVLEHPEHRITSDTMHYVTHTGVAEFFGPTLIVQEGTEIRTTRGRYDTRSGYARATRRSSVMSEGRSMFGDSLHYDRKSGAGRVWGNVLVSDTASGMDVIGDEGFFNEVEDRAVVTGHAELQLRMGSDTLYLHADTLFTLPDGEQKKVLAHRHVKFFRSDLQGACDTLVYSEADSLISLFHAPVLWSGSDQITGRSIRIKLRDGKADTLFVEEDAFLISEVDSGRFDQVTGRDMTGLFAEQGLRELLVEGNSRTVYFAKEKKGDEERIMGVNRADCSRIRVHLRDGKVGTVSFLDRPDAILYPLEKAPPEELRMQGADWRIEERPLDREDIF